jgi:DNA polymerase III subunit epsilon
VRPSTPAAAQYARADLPAPSTPWRSASFCVVDLETTGLDPRSDEIISFAAIPVDGGRVRPGGLVSGLVRPRRMPRPDTIRIHGLRTADLETAPVLPDALDRLLAALAARVLVAHVVQVEEQFLKRALRGHGVRLRGAAIDTARLAEVVLGPRPRGDPFALGAVATRLGLPVHRPHHADGDALTTAQVFIALASRIEQERESQTVQSLRRASRRRRGWLRAPLSDS